MEQDNNIRDSKHVNFTSIIVRRRGKKEKLVKVKKYHHHLNKKKEIKSEDAEISSTAHGLFVVFESKILFRTFLVETRGSEPFVMLRFGLENVFNSKSEII